MAGIYDTIQSRIKAAYVGKLADAVTSFVIFYRDPGSGTYDTSDSSFSPQSPVYPATTVAGVSYSDGTCRGVLSDLDAKDNVGDDYIDNIKFNYKIQYLTVLDSELNSHVFDFDNRKYYATIGSTTFEIVHAPQDPAKATFKLLLREVQD